MFAGKYDTARHDKTGQPCLLNRDKGVALRLLRAAPKLAGITPNASCTTHMCAVRAGERASKARSWPAFTTRSRRARLLLRPRGVCVHGPLQNLLEYVPPQRVGAQAPGRLGGTSQALCREQALVAKMDGV